MTDATMFSAIDLRSVVRASDVQIARWIKAGKFPPPIYTSGRRYWPKKVIERWLERKIAETEAAA